MFGRRSQRETGNATPPRRDVPNEPAANRPYRRPDEPTAERPAAGAAVARPAEGAAARQPTGESVPGAAGNAKQLFVGREIVLSGEIHRCDTLVVEGQVDAVLKEGRSLSIAESGMFKGTVGVESADVSGRLDGTITVRGRLTIRATGRVEGTVRYGELAIEQGGILVGQVEALTGQAATETATSTATPAAPAQAAAGGASQAAS